MAESKIERMRRLSQKQENIRNICTSAHIHHGKCVAPHTRIILPDGKVVPIEKVFENAARCARLVRKTADDIVYDIRGKGLKIFSFNAKTGRIELKEASHAWKLRGGKMITLTSRTGLRVSTTPEHKYLVLEDMDFVYKEARDLKLGDRIVCARQLDVKPTMNFKEYLLNKLARGNWYARVKDDFGKKLRSYIKKQGTERIWKSSQSHVQLKSFYHGVWQNRYALSDLLAISTQKGISIEDLYLNITSISYRESTKSTQSIKLPTNAEKLFELAGLFFGDGCQNRFVVGKPELADRFLTCCKELNVIPKWRRAKGKTPELSVTHAITELLKALFDYPVMRKSHSIRVPEFLFEASDDCVKAFLRAYFDCDGTVEKSRRAISITSVSNRMLHDLQLLLLRFGCTSILQKDTLYISGDSASKFTKHVGFGLLEKQQKAIHLANKTQGSIVTDTIPLSSKTLTSVRKVPMASISHHYYKYEKGMLTPTRNTLISLQEKATPAMKPIFERLLSPDIAFVEVKALESSEEETVYDITVPDNHNFVAEGIVIHNTAFTDNLLAASGFMSETAAGDLDKGMATWQHSDEQERLMTVDAANVSMVHEFGGEEYLINLIDTPGHIDFGGNVTRAMRAIDGTIVLVCASEGIMPQTETVLKQALRERVKPILFINKVDRLINEMQYTAEQIQEKFIKIITEFNRLIVSIAEKEYGEKWKVNIQDGSVCFGSARDNWAVSLPYMQKKNVKMPEIVEIYKKPQDEREKWFWDNCPVHEVLMDAVIKHLPNPAEAQKYRIPHIWRGDIESEFGQDLLNCNPKGKLAFVITRIMFDPKAGREFSAGRIYSGTIKQGQEVYLNGGKQTQRVQQVLMYQGIKPEMIEEVPAGNVLALVGLQSFAGETITSEPEQPFEALKHIFEPVISKAIKPAKPQDLSKLVEVLRKVGKEDPSVKIEINQETGENVMSGMGELHLEIIENRIKTEKGVQIVTSPPIIVYRETVTKKSREHEGKSPNKHNKLYFYVEPLEPAIAAAIKKGEIPEGKVKKRDIELRDKFTANGYDNDTALSVKDIYNGNILIDATRGNIQLAETIELVVEGFRQVCNGGPLAREPMIGLKVTLADAKLHEDAIHRGPAQIYPCVREGIKLAIMDAGPSLFEPVQTHLIEAPQEYTGDVTKLVMNKRGQVLELKQQGHLSIVKAKMPVGEMIGWSSDLRSATGGRGQSALADQEFQRVPTELQKKIIQQIVSRKGLTAGQLGA